MNVTNDILERYYNTIGYKYTRSYIECVNVYRFEFVNNYYYVDFTAIYKDGSSSKLSDIIHPDRFIEILKMVRSNKIETILES